MEKGKRIEWGPIEGLGKAGRQREDQVNKSIAEKLGITVKEAIKRREDLANLPYKKNAKKLGISVKEFLDWCGLMHWRDGNKDLEACGHAPLPVRYPLVSEEEAAWKLEIFPEEVGYFCQEVDSRWMGEAMRREARKRYWLKGLWLADLWKVMNSALWTLVHLKYSRILSGSSISSVGTNSDPSTASPIAFFRESIGNGGSSTVAYWSAKREIASDAALGFPSRSG